jgi:hypothetical protein
MIGHNISFDLGRKLHQKKTKEEEEEKIISSKA